ncbi:MAG: response regulator transcription factor [Bacteroidaceae bacterium]|nr:response regulator transcription factor [Bacteroidaceae bacterium]
MKILIIDDDIALCALVKRHLEKHGDECECLYNLENVSMRVKEAQPDIILLDIGFEGADGVWSLPTIENAAPFASIIFITSHTESSEMVRALKAGGNYYIKKPLQMDELTAIINSQKRYLITNNPTIKIGTFNFNRKNQTLSVGQQTIQLTAFESRLLNLLVMNQGNVVMRTEIYQHLWKSDDSTAASLNNLVCHLRDYFPPESGVEIETIWGAGYKLTVKE